MINLSDGFIFFFSTGIEQTQLRPWSKDLLFNTFCNLFLNAVYGYARWHSDRLLVHKANVCLPEELLLNFVFHLAIAFKLKTKLP